MFDWGKLGRPVGITSSLPGEGWTQLGWLGVILWCGLSGFLMGRVYEWFVRGRQSVFAVLGYMLFLPQCVLFFRDGVILSPLRDGVFYLLPVVLIWLAYRAMDFPPLRYLEELLRRAGPVARAPAPPQLSLSPAERRRARAAQLDG